MESEREAKGRNQPPPVEGVLSETAATAHADILILLRVAFRDGPLNGRARQALANAAMRLGIAGDQLADVLSPLETVDSHSLRALAGLDKATRLRLLNQAMDAVALDAETAARGPRLRARLMLLLDLVPGDLPDPKAV